MSGWPWAIKACKNCTGGPLHHTYGARGYCNRCYRVIRHIERVKAWDRNRRETLRGIPKSSYDSAVGYRNSTVLITDGDIYTDEEFEHCRKRHIDQLEKRLALLLEREKIRRLEVEVTGQHLEEKFSKLLRLIRPSAEYQRYSIYRYLDDKFNEAQRRFIYAQLEEIIEQAPWPGVRGAW